MLPILVDDVYNEILQDLNSRSDVTAFMSSSRHFYSLAVDRLLQMGADIRTGDELLSFCHFMKRNFLDLHGTTNQLKTLSIAVDEFVDKIYASDSDDDSDSEIDSEMWADDSDSASFEPSHGASLLVPVLGCVTNITFLLLSPCEHLLSLDVRLVEAFAAFTNLQHLHLRHFGLLSYELVVNLHSPLLRLDIDLRYIVNKAYVNCESDDFLVDPLSLLRSQRNMLKGIVVYYGDLTPWLQRLKPRTNAYVFPTAYAVLLAWCRMISRDVITDAFPNVRVLQVFLTTPVSVEFPRWEEQLQSPEEVRLINSNDPKQWTHLHHVIGDVESLYMLALNPPHPISRLDVACCTFDEDDIARLHTVITDLRPRHLLLAWGYWDALMGLEPGDSEVSPDQVAELLAGLPEDCRQQIVCLELDGRISKFSLHTAVPYMDAIAILLDGLPNVHTFSLRAQPLSPVLHFSQPEDEAFQDTSAFANAFEDIGLAAWATWLAWRVPSLRTIRFSIMEHRMHWHVTREMGEPLPRLHRLEGAEGPWFEVVPGDNPGAIRIY